MRNHRDLDFQDYCRIVKQELDDAIRRQLATFIDNASPQHAAALMALLEGGKKIRGCLLCMICEVLGGDLEDALPRATAVELIQTATLIHDDFVDQDRMRRSVPAVWTLEGARRAVLLGDVIFATAIRMMSDLSREDGWVVSDAIARISRGAILEPLEPAQLARDIEYGALCGDLYDDILRLKTGYLFGAACRLGAIAANAGEKIGESLFRYGVRIGEAYQIEDDLKDLTEYLSNGSLSPAVAALLAPACLHFAPGMKLFLIDSLEGRAASPADDPRVHRESLVSRMRTELENRLQHAVSEIEECIPAGTYGDLAYRAPWEMIRMFHESGDVPLGSHHGCGPEEERLDSNL